MSRLVIAGDWGTTAARFWLCDESGAVIEERHGPGVAMVGGSAGGFADVLQKVCSGWPVAPVVLCGMVGSNIGWHPADYLDSDADLRQLGEAATVFRSNNRVVAILPGVRGLNPLGERDYMRGEETQIAGALDFEDGDALTCLPGTHNKWVELRNNAISRFITLTSGELFSALVSNSVLLAANSAGDEGIAVNEAFLDGVQLAIKSAGALLPLLFSVRARQIANILAPGDAQSFLSGLIIGCDTAYALRIFAPDTGSTVRLICSETLASRYAAALSEQGFGAQALPGSSCARNGLVASWRRHGDRWSSKV